MKMIIALLLVTIFVGCSTQTRDLDLAAGFQTISAAKSAAESNDLEAGFANPPHSAGVVLCSVFGYNKKAVPKSICYVKFLSCEKYCASGGGKS